jgi:AcrR family transcriptional regulator
MLREDEEPTVASAAERALVSRTTAYRYFPTHEALLQAIAQLHPAVAVVDEVVDKLSSDDAEERLLEVLDAFNRVVIEDEVHMRTALKVFQENWLQARRAGEHDPYVRSRRRMRWLDEALRPLDDLPDDKRRRLRAALALTLGIDSIVIMKDVCQLDDDEALAVLGWAASVLLRGCLATDRT